VRVLAQREPSPSFVTVKPRPLPASPPLCMASALCIPQAVPLPRRPVLARSLAPPQGAGAAGFGEDAPPGLRAGEVVNVIGLPGSSLVYAIACGGTGGLREGWLPSGLVQPLAREEASALSLDVVLPLSELLRHSTLVRVETDWQDLENSSTLPLCYGELLQVSHLSHHRDGWAYGWSLERSGSAEGWFPLACVRRLEPSLDSLVRREEETLSPCAAAALVELLKSTPKPAAQAWTWEGELPTAVSESTREDERCWQQRFAKIDADEAEEARQVGGHDSNTGNGTAAERESEIVLLDEDMPEDSYPLVVCKTPFTPGKGVSRSMLRLEVGDLARVTSMLDAAMYHGFLEGRPASRGWFPRSNVQLVEDPLDPEADVVPTHIGPPPLPQVPPSLMRRPFS